MRILAKLFILSVFIAPACGAEPVKNWYAPKILKYDHDNAPDFYFLVGQWQSADKKFTENWSLDAEEQLIGLRTFIGNNKQEECNLFIFKGSRVGARVNLRRMDGRLEDLLPSKERFVEGSWKAPVSHRGSFSCCSNQGLRITSTYDCPNKNELNIEIETGASKTKVHLQRVKQTPSE
jgi:hypothetical protein